MGKIGVAMTVQNRTVQTKRAISNWKKNLPKGCVFIVVDDGSDVPFEYDGDYFRFEKSVGIARAKNKCLELLEDAGVEHAFLADSDIWPKSPQWYKPYCNSPEPHLSYQFLDLAGPVKLHDTKRIFQDAEHKAHSCQRGALLYYHLPTILPRVGGMDPVFGRAIGEHTELADRIHAAGLTTFRYADVIESFRLWHSMDEHRESERTLNKKELDAIVGTNIEVWKKRRKDGVASFVPYRENPSPKNKRNVIITCLLTSFQDPQRGYTWSPDVSVVSPWVESVERWGLDGVLIADQLKKMPRGYAHTKVHKVGEPVREYMNVYYLRWLHIYQYLRDHEEIEWVWCTDGSDVTILRDPFEDMKPSTLYVGVENARVGCQWMRKNHPASVLQEAIDKYASRTLLNAGVVGGERKLVMELAHRIQSLYQDIEIDRFEKLEKQGKEIGDMAAFNKVCYDHFASRLSYGPHVTTEFRSNQPTEEARFQHK